MKTFEELKCVYDNFIQSLHKHYRVIREDSTCDKNGIGINLDDRFSSCSMTISIDSWRGYYGSSNCSTSIKITNEKIFKQHFKKVLNDNIQDLLYKTADSMKSELKKGASKELEKKHIEELELLLNPVDNN